MPSSAASTTFQSSIDTASSQTSPVAIAGISPSIRRSANTCALTRPRGGVSSSSSAVGISSAVDIATASFCPRVVIWF